MTFETILTGYGLTETSAVVAVCHHDDDPETIANWSGRAIPDIEVRVDRRRRQRAAGETPGEVVVRGYNVMRGYWDEPEQTAATIDAEGWLHTGDIGIMDDRGYVKITDRKKDMFIVGGFNAYPAEIENILLGDERIAQVAVVGVPDDRHGRGRDGLRDPAPRRDGHARRRDRVVHASTWPTTRCRATSRSSTNSRSTRRARC